MKAKTKSRAKEIVDYDTSDTTGFIRPEKHLCLSDIGISLPPTPPTQVVSIRLPTQLLNELRAMGSAQDVPYQALIKLFLADAVAKRRKQDSRPA
jgi:hypothetical protein